METVCASCSEKAGKMRKGLGYNFARMGARQKRRVVRYARSARQHSDYILEENQKDLAAGRNKGTSDALLDRLAPAAAQTKWKRKTESVAMFADPVGEVIHTLFVSERPEHRGQTRTDRRGRHHLLARPNVTSDAAGLCIKTGNAALCAAAAMRYIPTSLLCVCCAKQRPKQGSPEDAVTLIDDTSREAATYMMGLSGIIDVLMLRGGGAGLIQSVVKNATVPVIETGVGNCHVY